MLSNEKESRIKNLVNRRFLLETSHTESQLYVRVKFIN